MKKTALQGLLAAAGLTLACAATAQEDQNSVAAGVVANPIAGGVIVEYERLLSRNWSLGARLVSISYEYKDDPYVEEGDVRGFDITGRYYFGGNGLKGMYLGGAAGRYTSDWDWREPGTNPGTGNGDSDLWNVSAMIGYKHYFSRNFFVDGFAFVGNWTGDSKDSTGTKESELGGYAGVGVTLGITF